MLRLYGPHCDGSIVDPAHARELPQGATWVDLEEPTGDEEKLVERWLGLEVPTREEMAEIEPSSRLYEQNGALYMTLSTLAGVDEGHPVSEPIGFVLARDQLVTIRYLTPKPIRLFQHHVRRDPALAGSALTVLLRLLDAIVERLADELEASGEEINRISGHVFRRSNAKERRIPAARLEALLIRIGRAQELLARIRETAVSASRLVSFFAGSSRIQEEGNGARERVQSLKADIAALIDHSSFLGDNLTFLLDASLGLISIEQNAAMKLFSWVAIVFLPPTLIAGVYGMNFEHMPELEWLLGYPMAIALIVASMIAPYWIFRRKGWL
jgi:magnesium transporter